MRSFYSLLRYTFILQVRQRFWVAAAIITVVWIPLLLALPSENVPFWLSGILFGDLCIIGTMFIAGILFLEKKQGSVYAVVVTPVASSAWILSQVISLVFLCSVVSSVIIFFNITNGNWLRIILALVLSASFYTFLGFVIAAPFERINNYFIVLSLVLLITSIPVYWYLDIIDHVLLWLIPSYPAMVVLFGSLNEMDAVPFYRAAVVLCLWTLFIFYLSVKAFHFYVSQRKGM